MSTEIIKLSSVSKLEPATLVEVIEDDVSWGVWDRDPYGDGAGLVRLVAYSLHPNTLGYAHRARIFDLVEGVSYSVDKEKRVVAIDRTHPVGETRHMDKLEQIAYLREGVPDFGEVRQQFIDAGYNFIDC